jgi:alkanesulfonate monooxygenase SsuD/methylene tetrahydromethanopterin reductase-like flavin-dependent oxidoreductase (luciferase family)
MIGGNGEKRTLPLAAKYANIWNAVMASPERFRELNGILDDLLREAGREPGDVRRTIMTSAKPVEDSAARIAAFEAAGAEEIMLQWLDLDDMEGLRALAEAVN